MGRLKLRLLLVVARLQAVVIVRRAEMEPDIGDDRPPDDRRDGIVIRVQDARKPEICERRRVYDGETYDIIRVYLNKAEGLELTCQRRIEDEPRSDPGEP